MARLGAVLGGVLAELVRARVIADRLTRDLVAEYEEDPLLANFSVPRVSLRNAEVALRFTVREVEEAPSRTPDPAEAAELWRRSAGTAVLPRALERMDLDAAEAGAVLRGLREAGGEPARRPTDAEMERALSGDTGPLASRTAAAATAGFDRLPEDLQRRLGGRNAFRRAFAAGLQKEAADFVARRVEGERVKAALASAVDVTVLQDDMPADPALTQELRLVIQGEDLDLVVVNARSGETG